MWEPRGHADMYGAILTPPDDEGADFGVFFIHNEGYSTMCGHAIIALVTLVLETGMIQGRGNSPEIRIDAPAGRIVAWAELQAGRVKRVHFRNVPSFVAGPQKSIDVPGLGRVEYEIAFGGAFYAFCQAPALGLILKEKSVDALIDAGRRIKLAVAAADPVQHPFEPDLSFLYGTIFIGPAEQVGHHSRNVCIFADGEVDRSPTGTGVSARAALHVAHGELALGQTITIESLIGSTMTVKALEKTKFGPYPAVIPEVSGQAWITGRHTFCFAPDDPQNRGFILR